MPGTLSMIAINSDPGAGFITRTYRFVPTGQYTASGAVGVAGETLNFLTALNPTGQRRGKPGALPVPTVDQFEVARAPVGYQGVIELNSVNPTLANMILRFFTSGGTELTGAPTNYPAGLLNGAVDINLITPTKQG